MQVEFIGIDDLNLVQNAWLYGRLGQIFIALGVFMLIDKLINFRGESNIEVKNKASFNVDCKSYPFNEYLLGFNKKSKL